MSERKVRVRFAPSPTGPLHIGGVRTALYNFLFAKKHGGDFILRIEDTDQNRFVPGAEAYVIEALKWSGIEPNEGVGFGNGNYAPYRQSERKDLYRQYAENLVSEGKAYYAFDTSEELEAIRKKEEKAGGGFLYSSVSRMSMKNSLSLSEEEVKKRISAGEHYVIRIKIPADEEIRLNDIIRGQVIVQSSQIDDKVLFKSDGMPTYHLANVVDDYLMKITHVIRGEEWLPSAPLHVLLYEYLGWKQVMPEFAHLPLLLRPDGNGKLSKRDGDRLGFPVFPLNGEFPDTKTGKTEKFSGYREAGYFPDAFVNMLAMLGWNPGTEQEIFSMEELIKEFSFEHIHKGGAHFNPEKAKWFNQQYLRTRSDEELAKIFLPVVKEKLLNVFPNESEEIRLKLGIQELNNDNSYIKEVCHLVKEKASFPNEFWSLGNYFFVAPSDFNEQAKKVLEKKWRENSKSIYIELNDRFKVIPEWTFEHIRIAIDEIENLLGQNKTIDMQVLRILLTGVPSGITIIETILLLGKDETIKRIGKSLEKLS
ncbi:MAG: glutamate--tRNA ligase [Bacteroidetes bacterium]|nr:glutamate--tRNA ligase [Bacteroidota bacterium]